MEYLYYFIAYYAPEKPYTYNSNKNVFLPYSPIYRQRFKNIDAAKHALKKAKKRNPKKARYIFIDTARGAII